MNKYCGHIVALVLMVLLCSHHSNAQTEIAVNTASRIWVPYFEGQFIPQIPAPLFGQLSLGVKRENNEILIGGNVTGFWGLAYENIYGWEGGYRRYLSGDDRLIKWKVGIDFWGTRYGDGTSAPVRYNYKRADWGDSLRKMYTINSRLLLGVCEANVDLCSWWSLGLGAQMGLNNYTKKYDYGGEKHTAHVTKFVAVGIELNIRFRILTLKKE